MTNKKGALHPTPLPTGLGQIIKIQWKEEALKKYKEVRNCE
jgi:hypothetical protein